MTIAILPTTTVRVDVDRIVFDGFVETDCHVIEAVLTAADPEACAHELLHLGAHLAGLAAGTGGLAELEARSGARLEALAGTTQTTVTAGLTALAEQSRALLGPDDGEIVGALKAWRASLDTHLGELFDPDRKASIITSMETSLSGVLEAYSSRLTAAADPDVAGSPAGRLMAQMRADSAELKAELTALTLAVGIQRGRAVEHTRIAVKGLEYEPAVVDAVSVIVAPHGDVVEHVGRKTGMKGTKKGDVRVILCDDDVPDGAGSYIIEAKDRRLSLAATWRELDAAMANWDAAAAVAVFAAGDLAPTKLPFWHSGDKAIVVFDREEGDPGALALACLWARWVVRRQWSAPGTGPDQERMAAGIERIQRALARVSTIRRSLSTSAKATGDAREQLDELASEVRSALSELSAELDG